MLRAILTFSLAFVTTSLVAQQEREFEGRWTNQRTGASGTMSCVATEPAPGQWKGVFRGVFQGKPFEYRVDFQSKANGADIQLAGAATMMGKATNGKVRSERASCAVGIERPMDGTVSLYLMKQRQVDAIRRHKLNRPRSKIWKSNRSLRTGITCCLSVMNSCPTKVGLPTTYKPHCKNVALKSRTRARSLREAVERDGHSRNR